MLSYENLQQLKEISNGIHDMGNLVDIKGISIDNNLDKYKRIEKYLEAIRNPYLFKVGDMVVKVDYGTSLPLQKAVTNLFV